MSESFNQLRFSGRIGILPLYVLNSLKNKQMSGYEIMKEINSITEGAWRPGAGSIYPVLKSLSKKGFIKVAEKGLREKRMYAITQTGLKALEQAKREYNEFSVQRWHMIRGIMMTLVDASSLAKMLNEAIEMQPKAWERVLYSKEISKEDKLFLLRQHLLMLDRHYEWVKQKIEMLERKG